jgi:type I restriction enzyme S subunit
MDRYLKHFDLCVLPFRKRSAENDLQSRTLATLRDTLLPKLLSGEIRVYPNGHHAKSEIVHKALGG